MKTTLKRKLRKATLSRRRRPIHAYIALVLALQCLAFAFYSVRRPLPETEHFDFRTGADTYIEMSIIDLSERFASVGSTGYHLAVDVAGYTHVAAMTEMQYSLLSTELMQENIAKIVGMTDNISIALRDITIDLYPNTLSAENFSDYFAPCYIDITYGPYDSRALNFLYTSIALGALGLLALMTAAAKLPSKRSLQALLAGGQGEKALSQLTDSPNYQCESLIMTDDYVANLSLGTIAPLDQLVWCFRTVSGKKYTLLSAITRSGVPVVLYRSRVGADSIEKTESIIEQLKQAVPDILVGYDEATRTAAIEKINQG